VTRWDVNKAGLEKNYGKPISLIIISTIMITITVNFYLTHLTKNIIILVYIFILVLFSIYSCGKLYAELYSHLDYIELNSTEITFRDTPVFFNNWLPRSGNIKYTEIHHADLVEISHISFFQLKKSKAVLIQLVTGKRIILASRFNMEQIIKIGITLQGYITLSQAYNKILGIQVKDTVKDIVNIAKNFFDKLKEN